ncbi:MAG: PD40 domain-containing protein, partial [Verrucomicrobiales bacterium]|nr:PD40 domain-containing protein [Verrucomicrobiales bacterium]
SRLGEWKSEPGPVFDLTVSADELRAAISGADGSVRWIRLRDGHEEHRFENRTLGAWEIAFSPRGNLFAQTSRDGAIYFRDASTGGRIDDVRGHLLGVHGLCFSPDGERLVSTSIGRESIKLWDVRTRHEVATLPTGTGALESPAFSPDGTWLVAIAAEGSACVWHAPSLEQLDAEADPAPAEHAAP